MYSGPEATRPPQAPAELALSRMQLLIGEQGPILRYYTPSRATERAKRVQIEIERAADSFVDTFPKNSWADANTYLDRTVESEALRHRLSHEIEMATRRKEEDAKPNTRNLQNI